MGDEDEVELPSAYSLVKKSDETTVPSSHGFDGKGKASYVTGDVYEGVYANGQRHGNGVYTYRNKDVYEGNFDHNKKTGLGRMTYAKGGYYHGHFKDGAREGEGTFQYANGDIYSGFWAAGKRHGKGTYVFVKTKYSYEGDWKDGQIVEGTWSLTDGTKYKGGFSAQKPVAEGVWRTAKGTVVAGVYTQEVLPIDKAPIAKKPNRPKTETKICWKTTSMAAAEEDEKDEEEEE